MKQEHQDPPTQRVQKLHRQTALSHYHQGGKSAQTSLAEHTTWTTTAVPPNGPDLLREHPHSIFFLFCSLSSPLLLSPFFFFPPPPLALLLHLLVFPLIVFFFFLSLLFLLFIICVCVGWQCGQGYSDNLSVDTVTAGLPVCGLLLWPLSCVHGMCWVGFCFVWFLSSPLFFDSLSIDYSHARSCVLSFLQQVFMKTVLSFLDKRNQSLSLQNKPWLN